MSCVVQWCHQLVLYQLQIIICSDLLVRYGHILYCSCVSSAITKINGYLHLLKHLSPLGLSSATTCLSVWDSSSSVKKIKYEIHL